MLRPETFLSNLQCVPHQRLRFLEAVGCLQQLRQIVEADGDVGMLRPETSFINFQCPPHQRLRFLAAVGRLQQLRQIVEADGDVGMLRPETSFINFQCAPHQRLRFLEAVAPFCIPWTWITRVRRDQGWITLGMGPWNRRQRSEQRTNLRGLRDLLFNLIVHFLWPIFP